MRRKIYLTQLGLLEARGELNHLIHVHRPIVIQMLKDSYSFGSLSENSDYEYAKCEQAIVEKRIKELESLIKGAVIVTDINTNEVSIGCQVKLQFFPHNNIETYTIVGTEEANPLRNKISNESPIVKAILGKKVNDIVSVILDKCNEYQVKILKIM